jgi:hypothetical protein
VLDAAAPPTTTLPRLDDLSTPRSLPPG